MTSTTINQYTFATQSGSTTDNVQVMLFCGHYSEEILVTSSSLNSPIDGTFCHACQCQTQFATFIDGEMQYLGES